MLAVAWNFARRLSLHAFEHTPLLNNVEEESGNRSSFESQRVRVQAKMADLNSVWLKMKKNDRCASFSHGSGASVFQVVTGGLAMPSPVPGPQVAGRPRKTCLLFLHPLAVEHVTYSCYGGRTMIETRGSWSNVHGLSGGFGRAAGWARPGNSGHFRTSLGGGTMRRKAFLLGTHDQGPSDVGEGVFAPV